MLRVRERRTAEHFGILDRIEQVRIDLMESECVVDGNGLPMGQEASA